MIKGCYYCLGAVSLNENSFVIGHLNQNSYRLIVKLLESKCLFFLWSPLSLFLFFSPSIFFLLDLKWEHFFLSLHFPIVLLLLASCLQTKFHIVRAEPCLSMPVFDKPFSFPLKSSRLWQRNQGQHLPFARSRLFLLF